MKRLLVTIFLVFAVVYGCGGSSSSSDTGTPAGDGDGGGSTPQTTTSGVAVDPYLVGAVFCIDQNDNGICDNGEPESNPSNENGVFTFSVEVSEGDKVIMKTAGTHNDVPYQFNKMAAQYGGGDNVVVSPLTTLAERGLTAAQIITLLDPDGSLGLMADDIGADPIAALQALSGEITDDDLAAVRAAVGAYMLLRMLENNPALSALTGEEIMNSTEVASIADEVMSVVSEAITAEKIAEYQAMLPDNPNVPDIDIMDVINTAVTVCDHVMEIAEEAYQTGGNMGQAMAAVQQFKNNDLDTFIGNTAPAHYIKRLVDNNQVSQSMIQQMFSEYSEFAACSHGIKMNPNGHPICNPDDGDNTGANAGDLDDVQAVIAGSPAFQYDFDSDTVSMGGMSAGIYGRAMGDDSIGACYTNAVRNNASFDIPKVELYRCMVAKAAEAELLDGLESGVYYAAFTVDDYVHKAKISYSESTIQVNMCLDRDTEMVPDTENARIRIVKTENGYDVEGVVIEDNDYNGDEEGGEVAGGRKVYASASTTAANEIYSFIIHTLNEKSEDCIGDSGTSLSGNDDQCFLRYEGNIVYGMQDGTEYSLYNGLFAEKNYRRDIASGNYYYVGTAFATGMAGGYGYTVYTEPAENGFDYSSTVEEGWQGFSMITSEIPALMLQYFSSVLTPPERTVTVPAIDEPWNCEAEGEFVTIAIDSIPGADACFQEPLSGSGDITTCSEGLGSDNLAKQMNMYRCDSTDPLTNGGTACAQ